MKDPTCNSIVVLYRGTSIATARVVAATSAPEVVAFVTNAILREVKHLPDDVALSEIHRGRQRALHAVADEAEGATRRGGPFSLRDCGEVDRAK